MWTKEEIQNLSDEALIEQVKDHAVAEEQYRDGVQIDELVAEILRRLAFSPESK